jgi:flagellar basal-body rod protein FlgC
VRLRVIAENLANANSLAATPDGGLSPQGRLVPQRARPQPRHGDGTDRAHRRRPQRLRDALPAQPRPPTPTAVRLPNVNTLIEMTDMREAQRSYEANLKVIRSSRTLLQRTIDILR